MQIRSKQVEASTQTDFEPTIRIWPATENGVSEIQEQQSPSFFGNTSCLRSKLLEAENVSRFRGSDYVQTTLKKTLAPSHMQFYVENQHNDHLISQTFKSKL